MDAVDQMDLIQKAHEFTDNEIAIFRKLKAFIESGTDGAIPVEHRGLNKTLFITVSFQND